MTPRYYLISLSLHFLICKLQIISPNSNVFLLCKSNQTMFMEHLAQRLTSIKCKIIGICRYLKTTSNHILLTASVRIWSSCLLGEILAVLTDNGYELPSIKKQHRAGLQDRCGDSGVSLRETRDLSILWTMAFIVKVSCWFKVASKA